MRNDPRTIDAGVGDVVAVLNHIPGVATRASCEGAGTQPVRHPHAALAYVALRHPMPLQLRDFLADRMGSLARIEDDGIYCRWPENNRAFLASLESAARAYLTRSLHERPNTMRWPLTRLRARVAHEVARGHAVQIALCIPCTDLVTQPHQESHQPVSLLHLAPDLHDRWFAEFVAQPGNTLDPALIATDGWVRLLARTQRGDFGAAFHRRWLRYRARRIADLATQQIRMGVDDARRQGVPLDFFHDATHAVFTWQSSGGQGFPPTAETD